MIGLTPVFVSTQQVLTLSRTLSYKLLFWPRGTKNWARKLAEQAVFTVLLGVKKFLIYWAISVFSWDQNQEVWSIGRFSKMIGKLFSVPVLRTYEWFRHKGNNVVSPIAMFTQSWHIYHISWLQIGTLWASLFYKLFVTA